MEKPNNEALWKEFVKNRDDRDRDKLILSYLPLVKYMADTVSYRLPPEIRGNDREDLYIEGVIGLMESIDKFDLSKNVKFETFASKRVRGAILDALRREDLVPKNVREDGKKIERAYAEFESKFGRPATDDEIAKELKMTKARFYDILDKIKGISLISLDSDVFNSSGDKLYLEDILGTAEGITAEFEKSEASKALVSFIERLDEQERIVMDTYYWDELTFAEIGRVIDVSESRVCQIHTKILLKLRGYFRKLEQER